MKIGDWVYYLNVRRLIFREDKFFAPRNYYNVFQQNNYGQIISIDGECAAIQDRDSKELYVIPLGCISNKANCKHMPPTEILKKIASNTCQK